MSESPMLLESFGFEKGAFYNISFDKNLSNCIFGFLPQSSYSEFSTDEEFNCSNVSVLSYYFNTSENNDPGSFSGFIDVKGVYYPMIVSCESLKEEITTKIVEVYRNPHCYLDYRYDGLLQGKLVVASLMFLIFTMWIINWFRHFSIQIWIHYCLTATFGITLAYHLFRLAEIKILQKKDITAGFTSTRIILFFISEVAFYNTMLLCIKGWCIVIQNLMFRDVFLPSLYSFLFIFFRVMSNHSSKQYWIYINAGISALFLILFLVELVLNYIKTLKTIMIHLIVIGNAGIKPKTTPIYQKYLIYIFLKRIAYGIFCSFLLLIIFKLYFNRSFTFIELAQDGIQIILFISLVFLFRLRGNKNTNYSSFLENKYYNDKNTYDSFAVDLSQFDKALLMGGIEWKEGLSLPLLKQGNENSISLLSEFNDERMNLSLIE